MKINLPELDTAIRRLEFGGHYDERSADQKLVLAAARAHYDENFVCEEAPAPYGYCPKCGARGMARERRIDGDDQCERGCKYPSAAALGKGETPNPKAGHCAVCGDVWIQFRDQYNNGWCCSSSCARDFYD